MASFFVAGCSRAKDVQGTVVFSLPIVFLVCFVDDGVKLGTYNVVYRIIKFVEEENLACPAIKTKTMLVFSQPWTCTGESTTEPM